MGAASPVNFVLSVYKRMKCACVYTGAAANAKLRIEKNLRLHGERFWIVAPAAVQIAPFQENGSADSRSVVGAEALNVKYHSFLRRHMKNPSFLSVICEFV